MPARAYVWRGVVLAPPALDDERADDGEAPQPGFYWAKVEVDDVARVRDLSGSGFYVVDTNVALEWTRPAQQSRTAAVQIAPAQPGQHDALLQLAGICFRYSRFHLDPEIGAEVADRVKREWVRSHLTGSRGLELLAASEEGVTVGFLAVTESGDARAIDLVGVAPAAQGRGIGGALVAAFVERHGDGGRRLLVGTQLANLPSLRLYERVGFRLHSARYVLHRHVEAR